MNSAPRPVVIWRFSDQKPGHDAQSRGLCSALQALTKCQVYDFAIKSRAGWKDFLLSRFEPGRDFPGPELIIGAGHTTHIAMLCARRARGGRVIVLMRPSLPAFLFDLCLIPEHDNVAAGKNILLTRGALNTIVPATTAVKNQGLVLIGGPSKHFLWDEEAVISQIRNIVSGTDLRWRISDSPRTPDSTRRKLSLLANEQIQIFSYRETPEEWVALQLAAAVQVWVSSDSISMIYEALTSGAAVGLLEVPARRQDRLVNSIAKLATQKMVTPYSAWAKDRKLAAPSERLNEADRAAKLILDRFSQG